MKVFFNARCREASTSGDQTHMRAFVDRARALGHEVHTDARDAHPDTRKLPVPAAARLARLKEMDVFYLRLESIPVRQTRWAIPPRRAALGDALHVWEFNTVPAYGRLQGRSEAEIAAAAAALRRRGVGCDLAVCVTEATAVYVASELGIERTLVAPCGSHPERFPPRGAARLDGALDVVWLCTAYIGWHDFGMLREAAWRLWSAGGDRVRLHVIGELAPAGRWPEAGLLAGMPPNVRYGGSVPYDDLPRHLSEMDVGICLYRPGPADYSSPVKVFDSMAAGLAVCATDQPQVREVLREIGCPELCIAPGDARALAGALLALAERPEAVRRLGARGRALAREKYSWRRSIDRTFEALASLRAFRRADSAGSRAGRPVAGAALGAPA